MSDSVPAIAYGFVGLTALVLTYATLADKGDNKDEPAESTTSMLPTIGGPSPEPSPQDQPVAAEAIPEEKPEGSVGGKKKKTKGGKKSKMNKEKIKNKKNKRTRYNKV